MPNPKSKKRAKPAPEPRGLIAAQAGSGAPPAAVAALARTVTGDGGELDRAVSDVVSQLKGRGLRRGAKADPDELLEKMLAAAKPFDPAAVRADQVAATGGAPEE